MIPNADADPATASNTERSGGPTQPRILLLDNYDSFTFNLRDYLLQCGATCEVLRNDACSVSDIMRRSYEGVVLSPGPGRPANAGIMPELIAAMHDRMPFYGVCLGMQAIGEFFGATLTHARQPMHGKTDMIYFEAHPMFAGIESPTQVMRYHSLILHCPQTSAMRVVARSQSGEVMALAHASLPLWGVQFHPESVLTFQGLRMLRNWVATLQHKPANPRETSA
ncbi:MAG: anthranilate synthase component II [Saprospiraceae bacterium]